MYYVCMIASEYKQLGNGGAPSPLPADSDSMHMMYCFMLHAAPVSGKAGGPESHPTSMRRNDATSHSRQQRTGPWASGAGSYAGRRISDFQSRASEGLQG
jgi:hypothetical protein